MLNNFDDSLELVLKEEGGYVDNPSDPGGRTNLGVTQSIWEAWVGHPVDEQVMKNLNPEYVKPLYEQKFWKPSGCDNLPKGLDYAVFDFAVNAGPGRSVKTLQQTIGCVPDGMLGPRVISALANSDIRSVVEKFCATRQDYYEGLKLFPVFGKGWTARTERVKLNALAMIGE